jgi:hypothetical protein
MIYLSAEVISRPDARSEVALSHFCLWLPIARLSIMRTLRFAREQWNGGNEVEARFTLVRSLHSRWQEPVDRRDPPLVVITVLLEPAPFHTVVCGLVLGEDHMGAKRSQPPEGWQASSPTKPRLKRAVRPARAQAVGRPWHSKRKRLGCHIRWWSLRRVNRPADEKKFLRPGRDRSHLQAGHISIHSLRVIGYLLSGLRGRLLVRRITMLYNGPL